MKKDEIEKKRQKYNKDIVERMKRGEDLTDIDMMESWFPPRPKIKKDKKLMARLYGKEEDEDDTKSSQPKKTLKLVSSQPSKSR